MSDKKTFTRAHERKHRDTTFSVLPMRPFQLRAVFVVLTISLFAAGCAGPRDAKYAPRELAVKGQVWPPDIVRGGAGSTGVYPVNAKSDSTVLCCWVAPHARVTVQKETSTGTLHVNFYIPKTPPFTTQPQTLMVRLVGMAPEIIRDLNPGFHSIVLKLPRRLRPVAGKQVVILNSRTALAPGGSNRVQYAILLLSIYFR